LPENIAGEGHGLHQQCAAVRLCWGIGESCLSCRVRVQRL